MKDQDLYNHFSSRKHSYDEMPSPELWDKISSQMQRPNSKSEFWSAGKIIILIIAVIAGTTSLLWINRESSLEVKKSPPLEIENTPAVRSNNEYSAPFVSDSAHQANVDTAQNQHKKRQVYVRSSTNTKQSLPSAQTNPISNFQKKIDTVRVKPMLPQTTGGFMIQNNYKQVQHGSVFFVKPNKIKIDSTNLDSIVRLPRIPKFSLDSIRPR